MSRKFAVGYLLDELKNYITSETPGVAPEPSIDYVATKIPRLAFEKFPQAEPTLTTQMKTVGEAMAIGRTFKEILLKCLRPLETRWPCASTRSGLGGDGKLWRSAAPRATPQSQRKQIHVKRPRSPLPSPQGEGTAVVCFPVARRASANHRRTTYQETGERFSFSSGEKAGMRASVQTIFPPIFLRTRQEHGLKRMAAVLQNRYAQTRFSRRQNPPDRCEVVHARTARRGG